MPFVSKGGCAVNGTGKRKGSGSGNKKGRAKEEGHGRVQSVAYSPCGTYVI